LLWFVQGVTVWAVVSDKWVILSPSKTCREIKQIKNTFPANSFKHRRSGHTYNMYVSMHVSSKKGIASSKKSKKGIE